MPREIKAKLTGKGLKVGIVVSRTNEFVSSKLLDGAIDQLTRLDVADEDIDVFWVPGCFEMPLILKKAASSGDYHAFIAIGVIIRGSTPHFDFIASEAAKGIAQVTLAGGVPVGFGLITADTLEQAIERAGAKAGNKGESAANAAVEMANLILNL